MFETADFQNMRGGLIRLYADKSKDCVELYNHGGYPRGKTTYVTKDKSTDLINYIYINATNRIYTRNGYKLFISPQSNLPRDLIRNSQYKIVRDIDEATCVVIPAPSKYAAYEYNIIAAYDSGDSAAILSINKQSADAVTIEDDDIERIKGLIIKALNVPKDDVSFFYSGKLDVAKMWMMPKCKEYELLAKGDNHRFTIDSYVNLIPQYSMSVETLITWRSCSDMDLLRKMIIQSDWRKFPLTVSTFLVSEKPYIESCASPYFKDVLGQMHYNECKYLQNMTDCIVTPEDYALCCQWISYLMENNGDITNKDKTPLECLSPMYQKLVAKKTFIKPIQMDGPMTFSNIMLSIQNLSL